MKRPLIAAAIASLLFGCSVPAITVNVPKGLADKAEQTLGQVAATDETAAAPDALTTQRTAIASEEVIVPHIEGAGQVGPTPNPSERNKATTKATPTPGPSGPDQTEFLYVHEGRTFKVFPLYNVWEGGKGCEGIEAGERKLIHINDRPHCATPVTKYSPSPSGSNK